MKFFLKSCRTCGFADAQRAPRSWWMRLIPAYRHYHCGVCDQTFLARKHIVEEHQWMTTTVKDFRPPHRKKPAGE
jgi:hypothetical protein